jgi:acyl dehydratase
MTVVNLGCVGLDLYAIASGGPSPLLWTALFVSWMAALCCALAWYGARWPRP